MGIGRSQFLCEFYRGLASTVSFQKARRQSPQPTPTRPRIWVSSALGIDLKDVYPNDVHLSVADPVFSHAG